MPTLMNQRLRDNGSIHVGVAVDTKINDEAEHTLDSTGLSMSSSRDLPTDAVARKAVQIPVQAAADAQEPLKVPPHVHIEVMLEEIAVISVRLKQMEQAEQSLAKRKELREAGKSVRAMRFQFDPYNEAEVMAIVRKISQYAKAMQQVPQDAQG